MKVLITLSCLIMASLVAFSNQNSKKVAIVKLVRGQADFVAPDGEKDKIKKGMWLKEGTIIKTSPKSFVRLNFIDKSSMNVGPKSELKIEKFSKNEAGVINVLTGKIRSKVTKDYLNMDKNKSKLFVKSRNAVMGVRGTDFLFSANKKTGSSTAVLFEGSIVFNKIKKGADIKNLESIVSKGRFIKPGQVSVAMRGVSKPTVPAKMSRKQFQKLNANDSFKVSEVKNAKKQKSVVPPGLSGEAVSSESDVLKKTVNALVVPSEKAKGDAVVEPTVSVAPTEESKGFVKGDDIKPADGVVVHIDSGMVIPPGADSTFDSNTGEWVSSTNGGVNSAGEYIPPQGFEVTDDGKMLKVDSSGAPKELVVIEIKPVDQMLPIESAKTVEYKAPELAPEVKEGPAPAGDIDDVVNEFDMSQEEILQEEVKLEQELEQQILEIQKLENPDGTLTNDTEYLPPPPQPEEGFYTVPNTYTTDGAPPPPTAPVPSGKSRVIIQTNKK